MRGSVTAEFAVLLPGLVLLLAAVLAVSTAGVAQLRCIDAARSAARLAARHEPASAVLAAARRAAPEGAVVRVATSGDLVTVTVSARVGLSLPGGGAVSLDATSTARLEDAGLGFAPVAHRAIHPDAGLGADARADRGADPGTGVDRRAERPVIAHG